MNPVLSMAEKARAPDPAEKSRLPEKMSKPKVIVATAEDRTTVPIGCFGMNARRHKYIS
jgi:hypothetical protein